MKHNLLKNTEDEFITADGIRIRNLNELSNVLQNMDNTTFEHHVNENKNDFCNWITHSIGDHFLSKKLHGVKNKHTAQRIVNARTLHLQYFPEKAENDIVFDKVISSLSPPPIIPEPGQLIKPIEPRLHRNYAEVLNDLAMLNSTLNTDNFIKAYKEGNYATDKREEPDQMKETEAAFSVIGKSVSWNGETFYTQLDLLLEHISEGDSVNAKSLYSKLKRDYEESSIPKNEKTNIHSMLYKCYNDILKL